MSTSTSSFEPLDPHDPNLSRIATNMFEKISSFIQTEFEGAAQDYFLLEQMNNVTRGKYQDIQHIISCLNASSAEMNQKLEHLEPLLKQIDEIDECVDKLEKSAMQLDAYSQELEKKLQRIVQQK